MCDLIAERDDREKILQYYQRVLFRGAFANNPTGPIITVHLNICIAFKMNLNEV